MSGNGTSGRDPEPRECPECRGTGEMSRQVCERCEGSGRIVVHAHLHRHGDLEHDHPHAHDHPHHPDESVPHSHEHGWKPE